MPRKSPTSLPVKSAHARRQGFTGRQIFVLIVLAGMTIAAVYLWITQPKPSEPSKTASFSAGRPDGSPVQTPTESKTENSIPERVARHILLGQNEQPYVASITDLEAVKQVNPVFYKNAEQGDRVLIWADMALIYSPTKDKIVGIMTVPVSATQTQPEAAVMTTTTIEKVTVEVRNGSGITGLAAKLRDKLKEAGFTISRIGDAKIRQNSTLIVDLTDGKAPQAVAKLAELTGGSAAILPEGEPASQADILIIIGKESVE